MRRIRNFFVFWYHFIVGDDWKIAAGVIFSLIISAFIVRHDRDQIWWFLPVMVVGLLSLSLLSASRDH